MASDLQSVFMLFPDICRDQKNLSTQFFNPKTPSPPAFQPLSPPHFVDRFILSIIDR